MKINLLDEPHLEFGDDFLCDEQKMGIKIGGFFSQTNKTHRSEIHYGILGTNKGIEDTLIWVNRFEDFIEAKPESIMDEEESIIIDGEIIDLKDNTEDSSLLLEINEEPYENDESILFVNKRRNPDFPGFNVNSIFKCGFVNDDANNVRILDAKINEILEDKERKKIDKAIEIAELYIDGYKRVLEDSISKPAVCIIVIPEKVSAKLSSIPFGRGKFFNLRRYLKAQLITMPGAIPVQILREETITGKKKNMQDLSMQAWNFVVANYYKNTGTPWSLTLTDKYTCFIGISFHKVIDSETNLVRSSIAQAFNHEGKGIIFVGKQFEWDSKSAHTSAPHLTYDYAYDLIQSVLLEYKRMNDGMQPKRVVIHKTTDFWNTVIHKDYAEVEGFKYGIKKVLGDNVEIDLVTVKSSEIRILRDKSSMPVLRGTMMELDDTTGILYTTGYIPYYEMYPGVHIPRPLEVHIYEGESTLKKVCEEILALTKMNFNNCNYYDSLPITLRFAQKVGEIIQYMDEGVKPPNRYYFYM